MKYEIRPISESDILDLFNSSNDPLVRQNSFNQNPIKFEDHQKWFATKLADQNCFFYVVRSGTQFVASIRFDLDENQRFVTSIQIAQDFRGQGLASAIINDAVSILLLEKPLSPIIAYIKKGNESSLKAFLKSGYEITNDSEIYTLKYEDRK